MAGKKELTQQEYDKKMNELYKMEFEYLSKLRVENHSLQSQIDEMNVKMKKLELERQEIIMQKRRLEQYIQDKKADFKRQRLSYTCINPKTTEQ